MAEVLANVSETVLSPVSIVNPMNITINLIHYIALGCLMIITSQIIQDLTNASGFFQITDLFPLEAAILGYFAILIGSAQYWDALHRMIWVLTFPFLVYRQQRTLEFAAPSSPRTDLFLLVGLTGGAFFALFMAKDYPLMKYAFLGLLIAAYILLLQTSIKQDIPSSKKTFVILAFSLWLLYGFPIFFNVIQKEALWTALDIVTIPLTTYILAYVL